MTSLVVIPPVAINNSGRMPPGYNLYMQQYAR